MASKRNGASLAADPTLTGVWSLPEQEALRPAFQCRLELGLANRVVQRPLIARRSRRRRFRRRLSLVRRLDPAARRFRDRFSFPGLRAVRSGPKASPNLGTGPVIRPVRLCAFAASAVRDPVCLGIAPRGSPRLVPRPRGISPSRRYGSKIPSPSLAFRPLSRKGQSPSRCLEDALPERFGQARERALIHFRRQCQWTRVDNPTVRRKAPQIIRDRVARAASGAAH